MAARSRLRRKARVRRTRQRAAFLAILSAFVLMIGQIMALADSSNGSNGGNDVAQTANGNGNAYGHDKDSEESSETDVSDDEASEEEASEPSGDADVEADAEAEAETEAETDVEGDAGAGSDTEAETEVEADTTRSGASRQQVHGDDHLSKITICHATHSINNPYVVITVAREAADGADGQPLSDHYQHHWEAGDTHVLWNSSMEQGDEWDDIIPDVDDDGNPMPHDGVNWPAGQTMLENGCEAGPPPQQPDVGLVKSGPASATVGGTFSYTVTATNTGSTALTNVTVRDNVSAALTVTGVTFTTTGGGSGTCTTQQNVNCNVGTLQAGQSATVTITVSVSVNACPQVVNTATVSADGLTTETSNQVTTTVPCPQNVPSLALVKTGTATVTQGGAVTYTVTVSNSGTGAATNVVITDNLDDTFTGVTASSTIGTCSVAAGNVVTCTVGTLNAGQSATITINATAPTGTCPTITNQASGTHSGGTIPVSGTVTTTVTGCGGSQPEISVLIQKTNDANEDGIFTNNEEARSEGRDVDFHLVITNTSEETVEIVSLTDAFGSTVLDLLDVECSSLNLAVLDPGESVECTFTLPNYSPPARTALVNTAEVCVEIVGGQLAACDDNPSRVRSAVVLGRTVTPTPPPPPGQPPVQTTTPPGGIAFTGPALVAPLAALALTLLTVGTGLLWAGRRRKR